VKSVRQIFTFLQNINLLALKMEAVLAGKCAVVTNTLAPYRSFAPHRVGSIPRRFAVRGAG